MEKRLYQGILNSKKVEQELKVRDMDRSLGKGIRTLAAVVVPIIGIQAGIEALNYTGEKANKAKAAQTNQELIEKTRGEYALDGVGVIGNKIIAQPVVKAYEGTKKSLNYAIEVAKNAWYEIENTSF